MCSFTSNLGMTADVTRARALRTESSYAFKVEQFDYLEAHL